MVGPCRRTTDDSDLLQGAFYVKSVFYHSTKCLDKDEDTTGSKHVQRSEACSWRRTIATTTSGRKLAQKMTNIISSHHNVRWCHATHVRKIVIHHIKVRFVMQKKKEEKRPEFNVLLFADL